MVPVLDSAGVPLDPCSEKRARLLIERGRAVVAGRSPYAIRLKDRRAENSEVHDLTLKIDPGSKTDGMSVVRSDTDQGRDVVLASVQVLHKQTVSKAIAKRSRSRRRRRGGLWHRKARFDDRHPVPCMSCGRNAVHGRTRCRACAKVRAERSSESLRERRLPPSLRARVDETMSAAARLLRLYPLRSVAIEVARFDTQLLRDPQVSADGYQQGLLYRSNLREYVLHRDGHRCRYCGAAGVVLNLDHVVPESREGPTTPGNLVASCVPCNSRKGNLTADEFGHPDVQEQVDIPLRDAAYMNATRYEIADRFRAGGLEVATSHGGMTAMARKSLGLAKDHHIDALCVGGTAANVIDTTNGHLHIARSHGRGSRQRAMPDRHGFAKSHYRGPGYSSTDGHKPRQRRIFGFVTGDIVLAEVPKGRHAGAHIGRISVRSRGSFLLTTASGSTDGISYKHCRLLQHGTGWTWSTEKSIPLDATRTESPIT